MSNIECLVGSNIQGETCEPPLQRLSTRPGAQTDEPGLGYPRSHHRHRSAGLPGRLRDGARRRPGLPRPHRLHRPGRASTEFNSHRVRDRAGRGRCTRPRVRRDRGTSGAASRRPRPGERPGRDCGDAHNLRQSERGGLHPCRGRDCDQEAEGRRRDHPRQDDDARFRHVVVLDLVGFRRDQEPL